MDIIDRLDLETFKATFQKPSQIYRFLSETWKTNPLYLHRTLSYIRKRRIRTVRKKRNNCDNSNNNNNNTVENSAQPSGVSPSSKDKICYFNWICADPLRTSQKTKSIGFRCPWCDRDYHFLDTLMTHLNCCHLRFNFNLTEEDGQSVIEMTLNSSFDGSYCGFKYPGHDLRRDFRFTPAYPERRMPTTQVIYFKAKKGHVKKNFDNNNTKLRSNYDGETYVCDDDEADIDVCSGRLYYHTTTCLPVKPNEVDLESEADMDPSWLRERTQLMIDEFTDVNEGEKEILKLWNLHIMKNYKYKGDNMIRQACLDFVELEGHTILSKNLFKNFTLHLANLYDFGLLGSGDILQCIRKLKKFFMNSNPTSGRRLLS